MPDPLGVVPLQVVVLLKSWQLYQQLHKSHGTFPAQGVCSASQIASFCLSLHSATVSQEEAHMHNLNVVSLQ